MNLVQEMLLLDRAKALKIEPGVKEIESRLDRLADDQPQLLEVYAEEDLKEQLVRDYKNNTLLTVKSIQKSGLNPMKLSSSVNNN